ncbi:MAG: IS200/IS605 family transposase [Verrucomicrobiota bacterium]
MANTFTQLKYHCIWSTKGHARLIREEIEKDVWRILSACASNHGLVVARAGGVEDHVHVLMDIPKTMTVSEAMKRLKGASSAAINKAGLMKEQFAWQDGYGAFTVSTSNVPEVLAYIGRQRTHHKTQTFKEEFIAFLEKHGVEYDSRYLWG